MENTRVVAFDNVIVWIIVPVVVRSPGAKRGSVAREIRAAGESRGHADVWRAPNVQRKWPRAPRTITTLIFR